MNRIKALLVIVALTASIAGCNTVRGMGKDIERAGEKIHDVAD